MDLLLVRHLWGVAGAWEDLFPRIRARGYGAIEAPVPPAADRARFRALLDRHGLAYVAQVFTEGATVDAHVASFTAQLADAGTLRPLLVNSHSGWDAWRDPEAVRFFERVLAVEADQAVPVAHETHRMRVFYAPWSTARMLERFDRLRLCCDFSHWVNVCERLLEDQADVIAACAERAIHLHARVGYEEGPQVPDPRAPEWTAHVEAHERWWDQVWDAQEARGLATSPLTPEFGPPNYLHTMPYSNAPVADLEAVCDWQAQRQADRFRQRAARG